MEELECALKALATLLRDEKTISWYEVHMSRLVPVLLYCLTGVNSDSSAAAAAAAVVEGEASAVASCRSQEEEEEEEEEEIKARKRVQLFKKTFMEVSEELPPDLDSRYC